MKEKYEIIRDYLGGENIDAISYDELGMLIAKICSLKSNDPNTQVGSCIISEDNEVLSVGYNDAPRLWNGKFPWGKNIKVLGEENTKYPYVIHSETNALNNYHGPSNKLENATIYVTLFPCSNCSKQIVQSGIKKVIYKDDFYKDTIDNLSSKRLLSYCGVEFIQFKELSSLKDKKISLEEKIMANR